MTGKRGKNSELLFFVTRPSKTRSIGSGESRARDDYACEPSGTHSSPEETARTFMVVAVSCSAQHQGKDDGILKLRCRRHLTHILLDGEMCAVIPIGNRKIRPTSRLRARCGFFDLVFHTNKKRKPNLSVQLALFVGADDGT